MASFSFEGMLRTIGCRAPIEPEKGPDWLRRSLGEDIILREGTAIKAGGVSLVWMAGASDFVCCRSCERTSDASCLRLGPDGPLRLAGDEDEGITFMATGLVIKRSEMWSTRTFFFVFVSDVFVFDVSVFVLVFVFCVCVLCLCFVCRGGMKLLCLCGVLQRR